MNTLAAFLILAQATASNQVCGLRDAVTEILAEQYGERLTIGGIQEMRGRTSIMEIWVSAETGSFTVLITQATGISCIVAAGTNFSISDSGKRKGEIDG